MPTRVHVLWFFLITLLLSSWHLDQAQNANTVSRAAMVAAIVEQGTLRIDDFAPLTGDKALIGGHYYSEKAPLPALLVVPFHWILFHLGIIAPSTPDHINVDLLRLGGFLCGSFPFALIITLCWSRLRRNTGNMDPALLASVTFFGSFLFIYSGTFYGHLMGGSFLLLAYIAIEKERFVRAGAFIACAALCEYVLLLFAACWLIAIAWNAVRDPHRRPALVRFVAGGVPFALFLLSYNVYLFGSAFSFGYDHVADYEPRNGSLIEQFHPEALWGLIASPYRGLAPHMPLLFLAVVAWCASKPRWRSLVDPYIGVPIVLNILFVCCIGLWWGGWAFGPRHLTVVAVLLAYKTLPALAITRWATLSAIILGAIGVLYAFAAKSTSWYSFPTDKPSPVLDVILPAIRNGQWTTAQWPVLLGLSPVLATALFVATFVVALLLLVKLERNRPANASLPLS